MTHAIKKVTLIGGGSWATALAHVLSFTTPCVTLLVRESALANDITHTHCNTKYFPQYTLANNIIATDSITTACSDADVIIYASAMQYARTLLQRIIPHIPEHTILVSASKGIEESSLKTMHGIIQEYAPHHAKRMCVLSGPSFAQEVLENKFTTVVIAGNDEDTTLTIQRLFSTATFKLYRSDDILGVELAGAIKNIIAIATGIVDEIEKSYNARAGIITRGLAEMTRLGLFLGAKQQTFMGLAGAGDLLLTCTGELSRNRYVGIQLGKGLSLHDIIAHMNTVAEGIYTCNAVYELANTNSIYMPITRAVYNIIHGKQTVADIYIDFSIPTHKQEHI